MEQRRFFTFLFLCLVIWSSYFALNAWLGPKPQAKKPKNQPKQIEKGQPEKEGAQPPQPGDAEKPSVEPSEDTKQPELVKPPPAAPRKKLTLGSLDPATGHALLATFDSRGAAVERVELTNPKYRDFDDASGYIGHLGLIETSGGLLVESVGPGTPAALAKNKQGGPAGLKPGDILISADSTKLERPQDLPRWLDKHLKPEQSVELALDRDGEKLTFIATAMHKPVEVVKPEVHKGQDDPLSLLLTLHTLGKKATRISESEIPGLQSLWASNWEVAEETSDTVAFRFVLTPAMLDALGQKGSWELIKRYRLPPPTESLRSHLLLELELKNTGDAAQEIGYRLDGPTGLPLEGWWYTVKLHPEMWAGAGARDVAWKTGSRHHLIGCPKIVSDAQAAEKENRPLESGLTSGGDPVAFDYIGGDTSYFAAALLPQTKDDLKPLFIKAVARPVHDLAALEKPRLKTANTSFRVDTQVTSVEPGQTLSHEYKVFFGPKEPGLLDQYKLEPLLEYGWTIFAMPAKALRWLLSALHYIAFGNYGIAIILLTMIVRTCMVPFSLKQAKSAAMMQVLAPEMQRIRDKYKDDMEGQSKALKELYAKHNFNPFGGCLLVFFQLPIFVGLYRCLSVDIELRGAPLFGRGVEWASNLAGPDKLFYWKDWLWSALSDETGWLGPYFNVFPIITMVLFIIQQKMFTPPATDEQTQMQQKMMMWMTVWMGFMFYKVPAGLCIYFITSSLWGICERKLLPKPPTVSGDGSKQIVEKAPPRKPSDNGGGRRPAKKTKR